MGMFLRRGYARRGTPISDLPVGNAIKLNVGGNPLEFLIVHQGLPGDSYDESCDGAWLLMKDIYENRRIRQTTLAATNIAAARAF